MKKNELEKLLDELINEAETRGRIRQRQETRNIRHEESDEPAATELEKQQKLDDKSKTKQDIIIDELKRKILEDNGGQ